jgi:hypothetical protein
MLVLPVTHRHGTPRACGGPAGIGKQLHAASTLAKRTRLLGLVVVVAFGIGVPIAVLIANGQDKARVGPGGITLTANEATGRVLFAHTCATCHTLAAAAAVGHVGPDLDILLLASATGSPFRSSPRALWEPP